MSQVKVKENESLESALKRFKRQTSRDGVIQEVRKREHYEKPSVKRKKKSEAARKRKYKQVPALYNCTFKGGGKGISHRFFQSTLRRNRE